MPTRTRRTQTVAAAAIVTGIAAEILVASQTLDNTEHSTLPFIEKFRSI